MNQRDLELLNKQLSRLNPQPRRSNALIFIICAAFVAGLTLGGSLFARASDPARLAPGDLIAAIAAANGAPSPAASTQSSD